MRRRRDEEGPFAGLGDSSLPAPEPLGADSAEEDSDDFPEPSPSRANVLAAMAIADDETDLDMAGYYVQRAIAEALLLVTDRLADPATRLPES
jgi:hypothetical protein